MSEATKKKSSFIGIAILVVIFAGAAVNAFFDAKSKNPSDAEIHSALVKSADEINQTLPMMVDSITRLDSTMVLPGRIFVYSYTLKGIDKSEFDSDVFTKEMRTILINKYKTLDELKSFRDSNVEMRYSYSDEQGSSLATISVSPEDF